MPAPDAHDRGHHGAGARPAIVFVGRGRRSIRAHRRSRGWGAVVVHVPDIARLACRLCHLAPASIRSTGTRGDRMNAQPLGLSVHEAAARLAQSGPNEIARERPTSAWKLLRSQFASPLVLLLIAACGVSAWLGEVADAIAIGAIVLINGIVGFLQEHRAERAIHALRALTAPRARVI